MSRGLILFLIVFGGYGLFLVIGTSSTYAPIKEYSFGVNKVSFEEKLADRLSSKGWLLEREDTIGDDEHACYTASLTYNKNGHNLQYFFRYCWIPVESNADETCVTVEVVGAFNYVNGSGGYKSSDLNVEKLMRILDQTILNGLAEPCP